MAQALKRMIDRMDADGEEIPTVGEITALWISDLDAKIEEIRQMVIALGQGQRNNEALMSNGFQRINARLRELEGRGGSEP